jgi:LDH2 family malate/lactate/ureidoglycolate dehydrogenase
MFGTNPLAFAAPALTEKSFVLDMSTTTVTRGKIEVYNRDKKPLIPGWAVDSDGNSAVDAGPLLEDMFHRRGGGLVPLGGDSDTCGGHKGYGLAVMVDILTGMLSGSQWGSHIFDKGNSSARVSHFFGAVKIDLFCDALEFRKDMDAMLKELRDMEPADNAHRVYYAGLKEQEAYDQSLNKGIVLSEPVVESMKLLAAEHGMDFP